MLEINNENKLNELLNLIKEFKADTNRKFLQLENKEINCQKCKDKGYIDPFSLKYFKKYLFTKKYLVDSVWKTIVKTIFISILVILLNDRWYEFIDKIRVLIPWNDLWRKFPKK